MLQVIKSLSSAKRFLPSGFLQSANYLLEFNHSIKKFEYPPLKPDEIIEQVTKGGGPGGQKVNKATNCCQLKHIPTGKIVMNFFLFVNQ